MLKNGFYSVVFDTFRGTEEFSKEFLTFKYNSENETEENFLNRLLSKCNDSEYYDEFWKRTITETFVSVIYSDNYDGEKSEYFDINTLEYSNE